MWGRPHGPDAPRCPDCRAWLFNGGRRPHCQECGWRAEDGVQNRTVPDIAGRDLLPPPPAPPRLGAFHALEGFFFERLEDGAVRISCWSTPNGSDRVGLVDIPADTWCSAVASVSAEGETAGTWTDAVQLHGHR